MRSAIRFALLVLAILAASVARAQWPYVPIVQSESKATNSSSATCPFDSNVTSGNLEVLLLSWESTTNTPSISNTLGSSWTQKLINTSNTVKVAVYTTTLGSSGADTITSAITSGGFQNLICIELPPNWSLTTDASAVSTFSGSPGTVTTPSITTTLNSDLIFAFTGNDNSAGWQGIQDASLGTWYQIGSAGGADSTAGLMRVGGAAGAGNTVTLDNGGTLGTLVSIAFQSNALAVTSAATAPDGDTLTAYDYTVLAAGGAGAYTWSVSAGALPSGLSINSSTGEITGTPTISNNYSATIQVTDGTNTATKAISFKITTGLSAISFVQGKDAGTGSSGVASLAFTSNVTSGNFIAVLQGANSTHAQVNLCTDTLGTPFTLLGTWATKASTSQQSVISASVLVGGIAPSGGADTVTCVSGQLESVAEFSNIKYFANDNGIATRGANASPATITTSSLTTLVPNEVLYGFCMGNTTTSTNAIDSPFTAVGTNTVPEATGYRIVTSATGYTMSCDQASNGNTRWLMGLVGFRPANGTVTPPSSGRHKSQVF